MISGRQAWITAIECISAGGRAIPPLLIFKAKHINTAWIPTYALPEWRFSASNSGWTSDSDAYEWPTIVFEPVMRPADPTLRRLLIMDVSASAAVLDSAITFVTFHAGASCRGLFRGLSFCHSSVSLLSCRNSKGDFVGSAALPNWPQDAPSRAFNDLCLS